MAGFVRGATAGYSEGDLKWAVIPDTKQQRAQAATLSTRGGASDLANRDCSAMNVSLFTRDHQAPTIAHIVDEVKKFKAALDSDKLTFRLASGNVGVMAATNEAVEAADKWVNLALFASVGMLCLITFRSVTITLCIILPLGLSVVLCNALMAMLGIGLKVNTLPVVALGVGVGVDYGIYLFEVMRHEMKERNLSLREGFLEALKQRGTASLFTAVTMTIGVATWVFSALEIPGRHGRAAGVHVHGQPGRRHPARAGIGRVPGPREGAAPKASTAGVAATAAPTAGRRNERATPRKRGCHERRHSAHSAQPASQRRSMKLKTR